MEDSLVITLEPLHISGRPPVCVAFPYTTELRIG